MKRNRTPLPTTIGKACEMAKLLRGRRPNPLRGVFEPKRFKTTGFHPLKVDYSHR